MGMGLCNGGGAFTPPHLETHLERFVRASRNCDFELPVNVAHDRRKRKQAAPEARGGFFWTGLTDELRASLVSAVRKQAESARADGRVALAEHDEAKLERREERVITLLNAAVEYYAHAKELFKAWYGHMDVQTGKWVTPAAKDGAAVDRALKGLTSEAERLEYLRLQIDMRTIGLGWDQFKTKWSSKTDPTIGTAVHLRSLLGEILTHEITERRLKQLPTEAAPPQYAATDLGQLGTADADALAIQSKSLFSKEELDAKAEAAVERREAAGISDSVELMQQQDAPAFNQKLVGKQLEVLWKYFDKDTNEPMLIWATGRVKRIADGCTDTRTKNGKALLPAGMVLWEWDADPEFGEVAGERWLALLPKKWKKQQVYGWRYDPREFVAAAAPTRDARRQNAMRADE
jgi:hypothetical protein